MVGRIPHPAKLLPGKACLPVPSFFSGELLNFGGATWNPNGGLV